MNFSRLKELDKSQLLKIILQMRIENKNLENELMRARQMLDDQGLLQHTEESMIEITHEPLSDIEDLRESFQADEADFMKLEEILREISDLTEEEKNGKEKKDKKKDKKKDRKKEDKKEEKKNKENKEKKKDKKEKNKEA